MAKGKLGDAVVIVGAGPVGLYCAARLGALGVSVLILEQGPSIGRQGSKALCVQADVLELLDNVGCRDLIKEAGCHWDVSRTHVGNTNIRNATFSPTPAGSPAFTNLPQWKVQEFLLDAALNTGNVRVEWNASFINAASTDKSIVVTYSKGFITFNVSCEYLVGADGSRSKVRQSLGIPWLGKAHKDCFLIVDVQMDVPWPKERRFWFNAPSNAGRQIVIHPQPDNAWRLDWQLPSDADLDLEVTRSAIAERLKPLTGGVEFELVWASTYRFQQRYAMSMRVGNTFLIGDSAHALPPFGARGMNSGLQDAENLAWKIAAVIDGGADSALFDTFNEERLKAAKENIDITGKTIRFMVPPTAGHRIYRNYLLRLTKRFPSLNGLVNSGKMSEPAEYRGLTAFDISTAGSLSPGNLITNYRYAGTTLRTVISRAFTLILIGEISAPNNSAFGDRIQVVNVPRSTSGELAGLYAEMCRQECLAVLVRPDGYIAATTSECIETMLLGSLSRHRMKYLCWNMRVARMHNLLDKRGAE